MNADPARTSRSAPAPRPLLVLGAAGQLGEVAVEVLSSTWTVEGMTRAALDLTDGPRVFEVVASLQPFAIVNCVAYNQVDRAEQEPVMALDVNAFGVRSLARAAATVGATLVHYSTDFVFDGEHDTPYREDDRPNPRSVYAASKLMGEWGAEHAPRHYVLRVESLFGGPRRKGSLDTIIDTVSQGRPVRAFTDRVVSPSYVWDIARATAHLLQTTPPSGIYHCVNSGAATWFEVATEVKRQLGTAAPLEGITLADAALKASRPRYCALANDKLRHAGWPMPTWQDALQRAIAERARPRETTTAR